MTEVLEHDDNVYLITRKNIKVGETVSFIYGNGLFTDEIKEEHSKTAYTERCYKMKLYGYISTNDCFKILKKL